MSMKQAAFVTPYPADPISMQTIRHAMGVWHQVLYDRQVQCTLEGGDFIPLHLKPTVTMMPILSLLTTVEVVIMTTLGAAFDNKNFHHDNCQVFLYSFQ